MKIVVKVADGYFKPLHKVNLPEGIEIVLEINTRKWFEEITEKTKDFVKLPGKFFPDYLIDKLYIEYLNIVKQISSSRKECRDAIALFFACRKLGIPCKLKKIAYKPFKKLAKRYSPPSLTHYLDFALKSLGIGDILSQEEILEALKKVNDNPNLTTLGAVIYILAKRKGRRLTQERICEVLTITSVGLRKKAKKIKHLI
ncbi:MAG: hypothetical protein DRN14_06775 [Thermoplasmata archaeon]|nr:MAG: hypothetical protein DRN14_06775 [Thermoplasmata archaeon]